MKHEKHTNKPVELDEQALNTVTGAGAGKADIADMNIGVGELNIGIGEINIGVGELQECTVSKSMDRASGKLAQKNRR